MMNSERKQLIHRLAVAAKSSKMQMVTFALSQGTKWDLALKKWTELLETELPDGINLSYIAKFCSTTRSLYIETADQLERTLEFYEGEEDNRTFKKVTVIERDGKYYLPLNPDENISQANGGGSKMSGTTTWNAVRILQGPKKPRIDITDFTFAKRKGSSDFSIRPGYY